MISNLVSVREITFLRYCHQYAKDIWVIVDVSVDLIKKSAKQCEIRNCQRFPSGCVVQDLLDGYSKVIKLKLSFHFASHVDLQSFSKFNDLFFLVCIDFFY